MFAPPLSLTSTPPFTCDFHLVLARLFLLLLVSVSAFVVPLNAQNPTEDDPEVLRVETDLLLFPIRVRDKGKNDVSALTQEQLSLTDKDRVISSVYLSHGIDRVALVFALDQSGSVREIISQQRDAALALFSRFSDKSSVAVLRFAATPNLVAPFGKDAAVAREAFSFPAKSNQPTAIFDAAAAAIRHFEALPRVRSERRIVILLSDGIDNASRTKASAVIESANKNRISFYVIHVPLFIPGDEHLEVRPASSGFRKLAEDTGGKYFLAGDAKNALKPQTSIDLTSVFKAIEDDLKSQFLLGFYISNSARDGKKHNFSLSLPEGFEYQVYNGSYSRKQPFFVQRPVAESPPR
jgi:VWFA-related protein